MTQSDDDKAARKARAEKLVDKLSPLGEVRYRAMFGGHGIYEGDVMFGLLSSKGEFYFRVSDETRARYTLAKSEQFMSMPYFGVPKSVESKSQRLCEWGSEALSVARAAKKTKKKR